MSLSSIFSETQYSEHNIDKIANESYSQEDNIMGEKISVSYNAESVVRCSSKRLHVEDLPNIAQRIATAISNDGPSVIRNTFGFKGNETEAALLLGKHRYQGIIHLDQTEIPLFASVNYNTASHTLRIISVT